METLVSFAATLLSQIFLAMFVGFCWNTGMTELGFNPISATGAIATWFGLLAIFINFVFIYVNMFKNVMVSGVVTVDTDKPKNNKPPPDDDMPAV